MRGSIHEEEEEGGNGFAPIRPKKKYYLLAIVLLFFFLNYLSFFDPHRLLLPRANDVEMNCGLVGITSTQNITAGYLTAGSEEIPVFLYSTTVVRTMSCTPGKNEDSTEIMRESYHYVYKHVFLNISSHDVEREIAMMALRFSDRTILWKYDRERDGFLLRDKPLDRHGFSEEPIDIYADGDYTKAYLLMRVLSLVMSISVVCTIYTIHAARLKRQWTQLNQL